MVDLIVLNSGVLSLCPKSLMVLLQLMSRRSSYPGLMVHVWEQVVGAFVKLEKDEGGKKEGLGTILFVSHLRTKKEQTRTRKPQVEGVVFEASFMQP